MTDTELDALHSGPELPARQPRLPDDGLHVQRPHFSTVAVHRHHALVAVAHGDPLFVGGAGHKDLLEAERLKDPTDGFTRYRPERQNRPLDGRDER